MSAAQAPFDPLAVENVGITLALELLERPIVALPHVERFEGPGVYALYYNGLHPAYSMLQSVEANGPLRVPVYVGRALRKNVRSGFIAKPSQKTELRSRIRAHARSINQTSNLSASDFTCRYIVLSDAYIALAESVLITVFRPPWNGMGLGSNMTGGPRMKGRASLWDSLHPGRQGRPPGTEEIAKLAAKKVEMTIALLAVPVEDAQTASMIERIRRRAQPVAGNLSATSQ
jgi:hypothetical protein